MIVAYREADLNILTVMKAEDPDEILDLFEGIVYSMFKVFDPDDVYDRIATGAKQSAANG